MITFTTKEETEGVGSSECESVVVSFTVLAVSV